MRHAARVDANQAEIVQAMRDQGASVYLIKWPADALVGYYNKTAIVEFKTEDGDYTKSQRKFLREWKGGTVATIRDVGGALTLLGSMRGIADNGA